MIVYFDMSAFAPLIVREAGSEASRDLWDAAEIVFSSQLLCAETAAAIAQAAHMGRLATVGVDEVWRRALSYVAHVDLMSVDDAVGSAAAEHAMRLGLRGYDSAHCATALILPAVTPANRRVVGATNDAELRRACLTRGIPTWP